MNITFYTDQQLQKMSWDELGNLELRKDQTCRLTTIIQLKLEVTDPKEFKPLDEITDMHRLINAVFKKFFRPKEPADVTLFWDLVCAAENSCLNDNWNYELARCIKHMPEKNAREIVESKFWGRLNMNHQTAKTMLFARFPEYDYVPSRYSSIKEYWEAV